MTTSSTPGVDEIEVSLFGPGIGESVVVHLGQGEWLVVDSCRGRDSSACAPLDYLQELGVDVASQVKRIVATHAHTDHIEGLDKLVEVCESAEFVHPQASESKDFYTLLELDDMSEGEPRAYDIFTNILNVLISRRADSGRIPRIAAKEGSLVYRREASASDPGAEVIALAPSDAAITLAVQEFGRWQEIKGQSQRRIRSNDPNTYCSVLWVSIGGIRFLLGSDLLIGPGLECGWNAVLASPIRSSEPASCFKVPHHGAPNAHHPDVWSDMLDKDALALVAPYRGGRKPRPHSDDVERICALTHNLYITSKASLPAQPNRVRKEAAYLRTLATDVRLRKGFVGHVRARRRVDEEAEWRVSLHGPAEALCG